MFSENRTKYNPLSLFILLIILTPGILFSQGIPINVDQSGFVGMTLEDLIVNFGIPRSVYPVRGLEEWQDDVVFIYDEGDFYIYRDRVWQIGLESYMGIKTGDPGQIVPLMMNSVPGILRLDSRPGFYSFSIFNRSWPMIVRFDLDDEGEVRAIFIFRSDL